VSEQSTDDRTEKREEKHAYRQDTEVENCHEQASNDSAPDPQNFGQLAASSAPGNSWRFFRSNATDRTLLQLIGAHFHADFSRLALPSA
jgi:hypothetical protein